MMESAEDSNPSTNLSYGLLISRIVSESKVDLFSVKATEVSASYESRTFASMGYTYVDNKYHKKDSIKVKAEARKSTRIFADSAVVLTKEVDEIKGSLLFLTNSV